MNDYTQILNNGAHKLTLEDFIKIPFDEFIKHKDSLGYLFYYEQNEIIKFCLEDNIYSQFIKEKNLLNKYCVGISFEKNNLEIIDYLLENKWIDKEKIFESVHYLVNEHISLDYLPILDKEKVIILGNKAIFCVNEEALNHAIQHGFEKKDIDIQSITYCIQNNVNLHSKEKVLDILRLKLDASNIISKNFQFFSEDKELINEIFSINNQCMEKVISLIFKNIEIKDIEKNKLNIILKVVNIEGKLNNFYLRNKVLLEYSNDFSQEDLQKIKKFNKEFYREIEKVKLYQNLLQSEKVFENENLSNSLIKRKKI